MRREANFLTCLNQQLACRSWASSRLWCKRGHGWPFSQAWADRWPSIPQPQMGSVAALPLQWPMCLYNAGLATLSGRVGLVSLVLNGPRNPILCLRAAHTLDRSNSLAKVPGGSRHKIWGAAGSDFFTRGAGLGSWNAGILKVLKNTGFSPK